MVWTNLFLVQLLNTIKANLKLDLGQSILYKKSVAEVIKARLPWTLYIMLSTLIFSLLLGLILALSALENGKETV